MLLQLNRKKLDKAACCIATVYLLCNQELNEIASMQFNELLKLVFCNFLYSDILSCIPAPGR